MPRGREPRATRRDERSQARQHQSCRWGPQPATTAYSCFPPPDYPVAALRVKDACGAGSAGRALPGP
jgi:hypothetical protein